MTVIPKNKNRLTTSGLRMKQLVEATGVPKSTIIHYLNQGLLPKPVKTSPNMAYYPPQTTDRIKFIQHMQHHHRLSLAEIKQILQSNAGEADLLIRLELNDIIFGKPRQGNLIDKTSFRKATGLTGQQLDDLLSMKLLMPLNTNRFDPEDVDMGLMYARGFSRGLRLEDLGYYLELGEKIVDREMALRRQMTSHLPDEEDATFTIEMVKNARMCRAYIIDRLFQHRVAAMRSLKDEGDS